MLMTKRKPATIGEILVEEFMKPIGLTQGALAEAMAVQRSPQCDRGDSAHSRPGVRQQPGFLAQCAAAKRPVGSDAFTARTQADRTRATFDISGVSRAASRTTSRMMRSGRDQVAGRCGFFGHQL